jgi:hypothetical protein
LRLPVTPAASLAFKGQWPGANLASIPGCPLAPETGLARIPSPVRAATPG